MDLDITSGDEINPSSNLFLLTFETGDSLSMDVDTDCDRLFPWDSHELDTQSAAPCVNKEFEDDWHLNFGDVTGDLVSSGDEIATSDVEHEGESSAGDQASSEPALYSEAPRPITVPPVAGVGTTANPETQEMVNAPEFPADILANASPCWFWRIVLIVVTYLHLHYHLPHRGCTLLLKVLSAVFSAFQALKADE